MNDNPRYFRKLLLKKEVVASSRVFLDMVRLLGLPPNTENRGLKIAFKLDLLIPPSKGSTARASPAG
jgi:hypothetical protein